MSTARTCPLAVRRRSLVTEFSADACRARLAERLGTSGWFRSPPAGTFEGRVTAHGFVVRRVPRGRDSFQREARGTFESVPAGTLATFTIGINRFGAAVLAGLGMFVLYLLVG